MDNNHLYQQQQQQQQQQQHQQLPQYQVQHQQQQDYNTGLISRNGAHLIQQQQQNQPSLPNIDQTFKSIQLPRGSIGMNERYIKPAGGYYTNTTSSDSVVSSGNITTTSPNNITLPPISIQSHSTTSSIIGNSTTTTQQQPQLMQQHGQKQQHQYVINNNTNHFHHHQQQQLQQQLPTITIVGSPPSNARQNYIINQSRITGQQQQQQQQNYQMGNNNHLMEAFSPSSSSYGSYEPSRSPIGLDASPIHFNDNILSFKMPLHLPSITSPPSNSMSTSPDSSYFSPGSSSHYHSGHYTPTHQAHIHPINNSSSPYSHSKQKSTPFQTASHHLNNNTISHHQHSIYNTNNQQQQEQTSIYIQNNNNNNTLTSANTTNIYINSSNKVINNYHPLSPTPPFPIDNNNLQNNNNNNNNNISYSVPSQTPVSQSNSKLYNSNHIDQNLNNNNSSNSFNNNNNNNSHSFTVDSVSNYEQQIHQIQQQQQQQQQQSNRIKRAPVISTTNSSTLNQPQKYQFVDSNIFNNNNNNLQNTKKKNQNGQLKHQSNNNQINNENNNNNQMISDNKILPSTDLYKTMVNLDTIDSIPINPELADMEFPELKGKFKIIDKIGQGTFSGVYKSVCLTGQYRGALVALKRVSPTSSPTRILNEIESLRRVGGNHYISELLGILRSNDQVTLILPYFDHDPFKDYFFKITPLELKHYLVAIFTALKHVHQNNICHRDVKPTNFLYNQKENTFMLIDFGLAQEMLPLDSSTSSASSNNNNNQQEPRHTSSKRRTNSNGKSNGSNQQNGNQDTTKQQAPRAGTRGFRAPEVLLKYNKQTTAIDIWSVGIILLCMLSGRYPFFISPDDLTSLAEIISIVGTEKIQELANQLDKEIQISEKIKGTSWTSLSMKLRNESGANVKPMPMEVYDLLEKCLETNPWKRITASEALNHPFLK